MSKLIDADKLKDDIKCLKFILKEDEWEVMCMDCYANVGACCSYYTESEAIEAWNKRVSEVKE